MCAVRALSGPDSRNVESNSIETGFRAQVKGFAVFVSPSHVVRMLRTDDCPKVLTFRRNNPQPPRPGKIEVSLLVYFHAVPGILTRLGGGVEKDPPICQATVRPDFITHDDFLLEIPVIDVQEPLVGGKCQSVGSIEVRGD